AIAFPRSFVKTRRATISRSPARTVRLRMDIAQLRRGRGGQPPPSASAQEGQSGAGGRMATKRADVGQQTEARGEAPDGPLLDETAAVKKLIARGRERGYVTYDELNAALPSEKVSSEQIEDTMAMLSELGINVIEGDENDDQAEPAAADDEEARPA